ncbi:MAG: hypothetical protein J0I77_04345 [Rudaea sp.]|uniref:hypothetical protein n=1 Tax=unclassified Rudaea TaxID=2627037 RepID=UPI0010FA5905|nr:MULTISPECIES: hypothetical protein [unclassified Rudaea]MBN8884923.1 hypothetical protein [Rudaea sp.]MBR0346320.1 hypothetical protein [Rudaea sp.]
MDTDDLAAAARIARAAVGIGAEVPARTYPVRRLDRDASYVLVLLGLPGAPGWIAAVDAAAQDVMTWAANPSGASTVPAADEALDLVWQPGSASRSPLYPLHRVNTPDGPRFLDLAGKLHKDLK